MINTSDHSRRRFGFSQRCQINGDVFNQPKWLIPATNNPVLSFPETRARALHIVHFLICPSKVLTPLKESKHCSLECFQIKRQGYQLRLDHGWPYILRNLRLTCQPKHLTVDLQFISLGRISVIESTFLTITSNVITGVPRCSQKMKFHPLISN